MGTSVKEALAITDNVINSREKTPSKSTSVKDAIAMTGKSLEQKTGAFCGCS